MNYEKGNSRNNSEMKRLDTSQVHKEQFLLFESILKVFECLCGEISIFFSLDRQQMDKNNCLTPLRTCVHGVT